MSEVDNRPTQLTSFKDLEPGDIFAHRIFVDVPEGWLTLTGVLMQHLTGANISASCVTSGHCVIEEEHAHHFFLIRRAKDTQNEA